MLTSRRIRTASQTLLLLCVLLASARSSKAQTSYNFVPVTPCRVADTRGANGPFGGPTPTSGSTRTFTITNSACGIPSTSAAYSLNVTVVPHGPLSWLTMWPAGQQEPVASTLNSFDGRIKANAAIVPAGTGGAISVFVTDTTDVILDINGYFVPTTTSTALAFYPLTPCRIVDTRFSPAPLAGPSMTSGQTRTFPVLASSCSVPSSAQAYSLNFTVVPQGPLSWLTVWPAGEVEPVVSTLNAPTGTVTANAAIVPAGSGGSIDAFVTNSTDLIIDINGYFAPPAPGGLSLYTLTPCRVLDTRLSGSGQPFSGTLNVNVTGSGCSAPSTAQAYVFNTTVIPSGGLSYLTAWPQGTTQPVVSTLNAFDGAVTANMAIMPTSNGSISAFATNPTQLIFDISGYFGPVTNPISISFTPSAPSSDNAGGSVSVAATISNDPGNGGVNWTVACGSSQCGSFTSTHTVSGASTTYTAPTSVPAGGTVTITATAADSPSPQVSAQVTITLPSIQVSFSQTPPASLGVSSTANLYAGVVNDVTNAGVDWTVSCGSGSCGSFNPTHTASGAATVYTAPSNVPSGNNVTITATSTANHAQNVQTTITITNYSLSGTVSGPWVAGVTIALSGTGSTSTTTAADGTYSFSGLAAGSYTITPSLAGYTYNPAPPTITINSNTVQNFTAASAVTSYSISGTVSYLGSKNVAGDITYIRVISSGCTGCSNIILAGTTVSTTLTSAGTSYTVRGLPPGSYLVTAEMDNLTPATGAGNESNPAGASSIINITSANVLGANITVNDRTPITAATPGAPNVFPSSGTAFINYKQPKDSNNEEIATSYKLYYGTDSNASNRSPVTIPAGDSNSVYILSGLTNGTAYYFKMSAVNSNGESAASPATGPVTINASSGSNTVSGLVSFTGTTTGPLYVGVFGNNGVYYVSIPTPSSSPVAYSIAGVPSGTYQNFVILDINNNGYIDAGDITNFGVQGPPPLAVTGNINNNITLTAVSAKVFVSTNHQTFDSSIGGPDSYSLNLAEDIGTKRPVSMTLISGNNVAVPLDMTADRNNTYNPVYNNFISPNAGDSYVFQVTFSDGTTQNITSTINTVLSSFAQTLAMNVSSPYTHISPQLTWAAPSPAPTFFYSYNVGLYTTNGTENWYYSGGHDGNGIPSNTTNMPFNVDGSASSSPLTTGTTYDWFVTIQDANGNTAQYTTTYTPTN